MDTLQWPGQDPEAHAVKVVEAKVFLLYLCVCEGVCMCVFVHVGM